MLTGKKLIDTLIAAIFSVVCAFSTFVFYKSTIGFERPMPDQKQELEEMKLEARAVKQSKGLEIENITINLDGKTTRLRFIDLSLTILPFKEHQLNRLEGRKDEIHDLIIDVAGRLAPEDLNTMSGKIIFEERIKKKLNEKLGNTVVKEIFFSKFVIQ